MRGQKDQLVGGILALATLIFWLAAIVTMKRAPAPLSAWYRSVPIAAWIVLYLAVVGLLFLAESAPSWSSPAGCPWPRFPWRSWGCSPSIPRPWWG